MLRKLFAGKGRRKKQCKFSAKQIRLWKHFHKEQNTFFFLFGEHHFRRAKLAQNLKTFFYFIFLRSPFSNKIGTKTSGLRKTKKKQKKRSLVL